MSFERERVLLALSGGVDSAVAVDLLLAQGFDVVGGFMKCWSGDSGLRPCWIDDRRDALRVAAHFGIEMHTFDFEDAYRTSVVEYMYAEYASGRTPNPDVMCNTWIKFDLFLREAQKLRCGVMATGHHARVAHDGGASHLLRGVDRAKDQSYFLHRLHQAQLARCLFPVGEMTKTAVRDRARDLGLHVADKRSTRGICFVGNVALRTFLRDRLPERRGMIVDVDGSRVGEHDGVQFFTVGQRHGFGVGGGVPYYVARTDAASNTVVVARGRSHPALYRSRALVRDMHWLCEPTDEVVEGHVRYQHRGVGVRLEPRGAAYVAHFERPVFAVPPGQFLVVYRGDECLGGGVIDNEDNV